MSLKAKDMINFNIFNIYVLKLNISYYMYFQRIFMSLGTKRILIAEDDHISANYLKGLLAEEGYGDIHITDKGEDVIRLAKEIKPDLVIMDIMLSDNISGCEAALQIHNELKTTKIIFLTAYCEEEMVSYAIDAKAAAYLVKPYRDNEILATIKLMFAQPSTPSPQHELTQEEIEIKNGYVFNTKLKRLFKDDQEVPLGKKPLKLIEILAKNKNTSVSNEQICFHIWGEIKNDKTLRSLIYRIRTKLKSDLIKNINGLGYTIV